uniref:S-arrestin n=1 Tax=Denticeps clupeoides TaxID=299321 RepID=A0AAY4DA39_9TELE
ISCSGRTALDDPKHVVFKKFSRDKSVSTESLRDFVDHCDFVDPVDGVVVIDHEQIKGKRVHIMLSCSFRYGRADLDLVGMPADSYRRDLFLCTRQVYPPLQDRERSVHTKMQEKLLNKLGNDAYPFFFEFPDNLPCSVDLKPGPKDVTNHCAVEFEVKAFCSEGQDEKALKGSSVRLAIRKIQYAPEKKGPPPCGETTCEFAMSDKPLQVKVTLDKETYYHSEPINISVDITNSTNKDVNEISVAVEQITNVVLYSNDKYMKPVASEEAGDNVPAGTSFKKVYTLLPLLSNNREKRGIALDGKLKHEDTNLASTTIIKDEVLKEVLGMLVSYRVAVRLMVGGEVAVEVPFRLMHPKPDPGKLRNSESPHVNLFSINSTSLCRYSRVFRPSQPRERWVESFHVTQWHLTA